MRLVIVGNGIAGMEAAAAARASDPAATITIVSEESERLFSRTALMYVLAGQLSYRDIEPDPREQRDTLRAERVRARVVRVEPDAHRLILGDGGILPYDRLILATGSAPRAAPWVGSDLRGIGHFVTLQDLRWLELCVHGRSGVDLPHRIEGPAGDREGSPYRLRPPVPRPRNPVVIGGGLIGVEVVECLLAAGMKPTFLWRDEWFWPLALDRQEGEWIAARLRAHGATVVGGADIRAFHGTDRVETVELADGSRPCDLAVVAIGVVPNTAFLRDTFATARGGIEVDDQLRTSAADVWAAGDCAAVPGDDGPHIETLWYTSRDQGRVAGRNTAGAADRYRRGPWYNSAKLMDDEYTTAGRIAGKGAGREWRFEEVGRVRSSLRIALAEDDRVLGFNALGRRWDHTVFLRWIAEGRALPWVLDHLRDASFDTELVPPLQIPPEAR